METHLSDAPTLNHLIGQHCIIRTYSAGVHAGLVESIDGTNVVLRDAVRIWRWRGAFTLSEVSQAGVAPDSRIAMRVPLIALTQAVEIIPTTEVARATLEPRNG